MVRHGGRALPALSVSALLDRWLTAGEATLTFGRERFLSGPSARTKGALVRVLFIQQDHVSPPGPVGAAFEARGYEVVEFTVVPEEHFERPAVTVAFPDPRDFDVVVPMGAPWAVYDEDTIGSWIGAELELLRAAHDHGVPVLGICFGGQALAAALGGSVSAAGEEEIGWYAVDTDEPDLLPSGPWFEWHSDRFEPPPGSTVIARTPLCPQAYVIGRSMGLQFHPELTAGQLEAWLDFGGRTYLEEHGLDADGLVAETRAVEAAAGERTRALVDAFLDRVAFPQSPV
jgi:GMP synthase-like glutamine amidotransferase